MVSFPFLSLFLEWPTDRPEQVRCLSPCWDLPGDVWRDCRRSGESDGAPAHTHTCTPSPVLWVELEVHNHGAEHTGSHGEVGAHIWNSHSFYVWLEAILFIFNLLKFNLLSNCTWVRTSSALPQISLELAEIISVWFSDLNLCFGFGVVLVLVLDLDWVWPWT